MVIFFNFLFTSSHLHPLQVKNYDSNLWLEEDEDDNGKFGLERVKKQNCNKVEIKTHNTHCQGKGALSNHILKPLKFNTGPVNMFKWKKLL